MDIGMDGSKLAISVSIGVFKVQRGGGAGSSGCLRQVGKASWKGFSI